MIAPVPMRPDRDRGIEPLDAVLDPSDATAQVARLAAAGVPLAAGLLAYSDEVPSSWARSSLRRLSRELESGRSLEEVFDSPATSAPAYVRSMVASAARTGKLAEVLGQHLFVVRRTRDIRVRFWMHLAYPILLLKTSITVVALLLLWFAPVMKEIFSDFGVPLPRPTLIVIAASDALWVALRVWWLFAAVFGAVVVALYCLRYVPGRAARVRLAQRVPIWGTAWRAVGLSEFCSLLSILVECRLPLLEALRLTAGVLRDPNLQAGALLMADQVERGLDPADEVGRISHFPRSLAGVFRWTRHERALADGLRAAGEMYAVQARVQTGVVGMILQPVLLAGVVLTAGAVIGSLLAPLIVLLQSLVS